MLARDGPHIEFAQKEFMKTAPSLAIRSIFGVGATLANGPPWAEMAFTAWSSEKTNKIFGRESLAFAVAVASNAKTVIFLNIENLYVHLARLRKLISMLGL